MQLPWRKLADWTSVVLLVLLMVVPVGGLAWLVFFTETFRLQAVTVVDAREHTAAQVKQIAEELAGHNMLFLQTDILEQKILSEVPQVRTVHAVRKLPGTLKIIIQEKTPMVLLLSGGRYYFVDESGIAYEEARLDTLPGIVLPQLKNSDATAQVTAGTRVVEPAFIQFVNEVQQKLPEVVATPVVEIRIPSLAAREVHFYLSNNWQVRFDSTRAVTAQLAVLKQLLESTVTPKEQQVLEYIDLRIPNRVYYKTRLTTQP